MKELVKKITLVFALLVLTATIIYAAGSSVPVGPDTITVSGQGRRTAQSLLCDPPSAHPPGQH